MSVTHEGTIEESPTTPVSSVESGIGKPSLRAAAPSSVVYAVVPPVQKANPDRRLHPASTIID